MPTSPAISVGFLPDSSLIRRFIGPQFSTGIPSLDALLGGGFPYGSITEIVGEHSSGCTTLVMAVVARATSAGACVAWIDGLGTFDPEHAVAAGVHLSRMLWIRPPDARTALRSLEQVLDGGGFPLVLLDLEGIRVVPWMTSSSVWLRVRRAVVRGEGAVVMLSSACLAGSFATVRLEVRRRSVTFEGLGSVSPTFEGIEGSIAVRRNRVGVLTDHQAALRGTVAE